MEKKKQYIELLKEAEALVDSNTDSICTMANFSALIKQHFDHHWVGFYRVVNNELILGPFQGPVACTIIGYGKGVCGKAWEQKKTLVVDDVDAFPGHIACSPHSRSEIVVPCMKNDTVFAVLDIDSDQYASFDQQDKEYLEKLVAWI